MEAKDSMEFKISHPGQNFGPPSMSNRNQLGLADRKYFNFVVRKEKMTIYISC